MLNRLEQFSEPFIRYLKRPESQEYAQIYMGGLLSDLERKNIESIAYRHDLDRQNLRALVRDRHFLGAAGVACCLLKFAEVLLALEVVYALSGSGPIASTGKSETESDIGSGRNRGKAKGRCERMPESTMPLTGPGWIRTSVSLR